MFNKRYLWGVVCLLAIFSIAMSGCGGGGGSSSPAPMDDDDDDMVVTPIVCPDGQVPNAANDACVKTAATVVAETKAAATKTAAILAESIQGTTGQPDDAGLGGTVEDGTAPVTTYTMTIERDRDGTTVMITDSAMAGDDDPKFMQAMDLGDGTTMHVRDNGMGVEEVVIVTTDIEAPSGVEFAMWEAADGSTPQALDISTDTTNDAPTTTNEALAVAQNTATYALVMSPAFTAGTGAVLTFDDDDTATTGMDEAFETPGTYNGADGTYRCNAAGADCTVTLDAMGMITEMSAGWIFTPDADATSDQPDYDHLRYGFWLKRTTGEDGAVTYNEVETFAVSSVAASGDVNAVTGSATYSGGATGVYVHEMSNPAGNIESATSGHFTADVALTATFGQVPVSATDSTGTIAPNLLNTLSGTINNFMLSGHSEGPGWSVDLQGAIAPSAGTASGTAMGGMGDGSFSATFHGDVTAAADGTVPKPGSVVGEFNAGFSNGSVAGGFGAR